MKKAAVVDQVTHVATHPLSTAAYVFGVARGIGATVIRTASGLLAPGREDDRVPEPPAHSSAATPRAVPEPRPAAPQRPPAPPAESFATEPTAVSRTSAHGGGGNDADVDDWLGEAQREMDENDDDAAGGVVEALELGDRPGEDQVDHAAVKSVVSENQRLRSVD